MTDVPTPPGSEPPNVDGVTSSGAAVPNPPPASETTPATAPIPVLSTASADAAPFPREKVAAAERRVILVLGGFYGLYVLWCVGLLMLLPDPEGGLQDIVSLGLVSSLVGAVVLLLMGVIALRRISGANASIALRKRSLLKVGLFLAPGFLLSLIVPFFITREPPLPLDITEPARAEDFVAPLAVTFSAERAAAILQRQGHRAVKYQWDTDGDGTMNEETVVPEITSLFERPGAYGAVARIVLEDQSFKRISRRFTIPTAVFEVSPLQPIVERPTRFGIAHLLADPKELKDVQWDFGDGTEPETITTADIAHTYFAVGTYTVTGVVSLQNQSQTTYTRVVTVTDPPPLPFSVTLSTEPQNLIGPAPFGAVFALDTQEPVREIEWVFGDGKTERGEDLRRVGHSFEQKGVYPVITRVRNMSGKTAELTTIIRVTDTLALPDLRFEGAPTVSANRVQGAVPLVLTLTPKTTVPLVKFSWEATPGDPVTINGDTISGTFRTEGAYTITLFAEDPEGKAMRQPISVEVGAPAAEPSIVARPENGVAPLRVTFDASQTFIPAGETLAGFQWSFGDEVQTGRGAEPGPARVEHTFKQPGEYVVTLYVVMTSGKEYTEQRTIIVRRPTLSACITASRLEAQVGKGIEFSSSCSAGGAKSYLWDVRADVDPAVIVAQSLDPTYVHVFEQPGTYTVTLTIKDAFNNQDTKSISITVTP